MADLGTLNVYSPKIKGDIPSTSYIDGQVLDENNNPVSTMVFAINRYDGRYIDNTRVPTNATGNFHIVLPINTTVTEVQVICMGTDTTLRNDLIFRVLI